MYACFMPYQWQVRKMCVRYVPYDLLVRNERECPFLCESYNLIRSINQTFALRMMSVLPFSGLE